MRPSIASIWKLLLTLYLYLQCLSVECCTNIPAVSYYSYRASQSSVVATYSWAANFVDLYCQKHQRLLWPGESRELELGTMLTSHLEILKVHFLMSHNMQTAFVLKISKILQNEEKLNGK